ncbi:MAG: hypothetical protein AAF715_04905 [Myxococcota bacterium]
MRFTALGGFCFLVTAVIAAACTNDFDRFDFDDDDDGGSGGAPTASSSVTSGGGMASTSTSSSSSSAVTTTTGMGGGGPECTSPVQCPGMDFDCDIRVCNDMMCGREDRPQGLPCDDNGGAVCDGLGSCVECNVDADCATITNGVCDLTTNTCLPASCTDGITNGMETDLDCGGTVCNPCINGDDCVLASDCQSNLCDANLLCVACTLDTDCGTGEFCDAGGVCTPQGVLGDGCGADNECASGFCPADDGVCCDTACDTLCESCLLADTGQADGTCAPVTASTDPKGECTIALSSCDGDFCSGTAGACEPAAATTVCRPPAGACDPAELCDGTSNVCPADVLAGAGSICNASLGACDPQEVCDGVSPTCPPDVVSPANTVCGPVMGPCDAEEVCDGVSDACPADGFIADGGTPVGVGCGPYLCDGAMASCPTMCAVAADCVVGNVCQADMTCAP